MLCIVSPPTLPSEQAGHECSCGFEDMKRVAHQSQWLPHLNLLSDLQFVVLLRLSYR